MADRGTFATWFNGADSVANAIMADGIETGDVFTVTAADTALPEWIAGEATFNGDPLIADELTTGWWDIADWDIVAAVPGPEPGTVAEFPAFTPIFPPPPVGNPPPPTFPPTSGGTPIPVPLGPEVGPAIEPAPVPPSVSGTTQPVVKPAYPAATSGWTPPTSGAWQPPITLPPTSGGAPLNTAAFPQFTTTWPNPPVQIVGSGASAGLPPPTMIPTTPNVSSGGWAPAVEPHVVAGGFVVESAEEEPEPEPPETSEPGTESRHARTVRHRRSQSSKR